MVRLYGFDIVLLVAVMFTCERDGERCRWQALCTRSRMHLHVALWMGRKYSSVGSRLFDKRGLNGERLASGRLLQLILPRRRTSVKSNMCIGSDGTFPSRRTSPSHQPKLLFSSSWYSLASPAGLSRGSSSTRRAWVVPDEAGLRDFVSRPLAISAAGGVISSALHSR